MRDLVNDSATIMSFSISSRFLCLVFITTIVENDCLHKYVEGTELGAILPSLIYVGMIEAFCTRNCAKMRTEIMRSLRNLASGLRVPLPFLGAFDLSTKPVLQETLLFWHGRASGSCPVLKCTIQRIDRM